MRNLALLAVSAIAAIATPALGQTVSYGGNSYSSGQPIIIDYTGVQFPNSSGTLTLTFNGTGTGAQSNDYLFTYSLLNTSTDPSTNISGFGFDVSGGTLDLNSSFSTGTYTGIGSGSISGGASVDICATAGSNCSGGSNGGPTPGGTASGTFGIEFSSLPSSITLSNPIIRMQNTGANGNGSDIGTPNGLLLPEPSTWGMMLLGFGAVGFALRRSKKKALLTQIA